MGLHERRRAAAVMKTVRQSLDCAFGGFSPKQLDIRGIAIREAHTEHVSLREGPPLTRIHVTESTCASPGCQCSARVPVVGTIRRRVFT